MTSDEASRTAIYDGFISYSHAADGLLAPRLQSGLQRFAKPWWKRRALRLFRDEASLSANPHLWSSITDALDSSDWFVLLLSPDAAESEWVNQEIEYWNLHKDRSRILPVLTEGSFEWTGNHVAGSAVPESLRGVFAEEPRWVDLRFAKGDELVDLKNPDFSAAVADISSAIRGVPKDELASEEVRQHRRTVRTAWAAGALVVVLGVASVVFGIQSASNARAAEEATQVAEQKATDEEQARLEAERLQKEAEQARREAEDSEARAVEQERIAESRRLVAESRLVADEDTELSILLALLAVRVAPVEGVEFEAVLAVRDALQVSRFADGFPVELGSHHARISPDGSVIYHSSGPENVLRAIDVDTRDVLWSYPENAEASSFDAVGISPDGDLVSLAIRETASAPARVLFFDTSSSTPDQPVWVIASSGCHQLVPVGNGFMADGRFFSVTDGTEECGDLDNPDSDWGVLYDTETREEHDRFYGAGINDSIRVSDDGNKAVFHSNPRYAGNSPTPPPTVGSFRVVTYPDKTLLFEPPGEEAGRSEAEGRYAVLSPSGTLLVYDQVGGENWSFLVIRDLETNLETLLDTGTDELRCCDPVSFSPDGSQIVATTARRGPDRLFLTTEGGEPDLLGRTRQTLDHSWSENASKLLIVHEDVLLLWSLDADPDRFKGTEDWVALALDNLSRGFTQTECTTHNIDPCPTPEELRSD